MLFLRLFTTTMRSVQNHARFIIFLGALLMFFSARAEPQPLTLYFDFFYGDIHAAKVKDTFSVSNGEYVIESHAEAQGLAKLLYGDVIRKSVGKFINVDDHEQNSAGDLHMQRYDEKRGRLALQTAIVEGEYLNLQKGKEMRQEDIPDEHLLDYLTALYRSYALQKPVAGTVALTEGWRLKVYEYSVGEEEEVETPYGNILAVPIVRDNESGKRIFWLASEMQYIPVKFYIETKKGHVFQTLLTGINEEKIN